MDKEQKVLLVGATGYLGLHIVEQLLASDIDFKAVARNRAKLLDKGVPEQQIIQAQVSEPKAMKGICDDVDVVISCLGITRQQDGLTYRDVDYQANLNLLLEAEQAAVSKFIYVSAFNAKKYPQVRLLAAKEKFAKRLLSSSLLQGCVLRPNGFFSDMTELYRMAASGKVYMFGNGEVRANPIHGKDLARFCIDAIARSESELDVGGPEVLSMNQMTHLAFQAQNKPSKSIKLPDFIRRIALSIVKRLPEKWGGSAEFFLTVMGQDSIAPAFGQYTLGNYYRDELSAKAKPQRI
ncbi:SDR family oxidoreductase [Agarivorans aestuarii]|uniref:SDR family oxidoreductase n=1 Tax=Agarivorans aestuarii TaxID=1563703 RepID=UPI001C7F02BB|nr:SDR family oxidoreductase [Agarivorans aestuarii]